MDAGQQGRRARRMGRRAVALGAVAAAGLVAAPTAQAGSYTVDVCRDWESGAAVGMPFGLSKSGFDLVVDRCATGGNLAGQLPGTSIAANDDAYFGFEVPGSAPNARITRIQTHYAAAASSGTASVQLLTSSGLLDNADAPNARELDKVLVTSARDVTWRISCHTGADCTFPSATGAVEVRKARLTVEEDAAPAGAATGGPLLAAGAQSGTRLLRVDASDGDSGVRRVSVRLGGVVAGEAVSSCTTWSWSPCPKARTGLDIPVDTAKAADGTHALSLVVEDAAGNLTTVDGGPVVVDNVPAPDATSAPALSGTPVAGATLVLDPGAWDGHGRAVTLELRWQRSSDGTTWVDLPPAAGDPARLHLGAADVGARVRAVVRASSSEGSREAIAGPTAVVAAAPGGPGSGPAEGGTTGGGTPGGGAGGGAPGAVVPVLVLPGAGAPQAVPGALNSASGQPGMRMVISVTDRRRAARVRYGARVPVTGTLRDAGGAPVPGARVEVFEVPAGGGAARAVATVVTDAAGRFSHRPRTGPSRTLRFAYRAHHGDVTFASTQEVALRVVAGVTLRTDRRSLRNRQRLTFRGTVRGTSGRKLVELQVRRGSSWMTFATTFTRRGAFSYRYRFMRTRTTARFQFRARVLKDTGFAYETGASAAVRVLVRGAR